MGRVLQTLEDVFADQLVLRVAEEVMIDRVRIEDTARGIDTLDAEGTGFQNGAENQAER